MDMALTGFLLLIVANQIYHGSQMASVNTNRQPRSGTVLMVFVLGLIGIVCILLRATVLFLDIFHYHK